MEPRTTVFNCHLYGVSRAFSETAVGDYQGAVRVDNILFGSLGIVRGRRLFEQISIRKRPVFRPPAFWHPTSMGNAESQGKVQRRSVRARLAARNDFFQHG